MIFLVQLACALVLAAGDVPGKLPAVRGPGGSAVEVKVGAEKNETDDGMYGGEEAAMIEPSAVQALQAMWTSVKTQLENPHWQSLKALCAMILGLVMLYEGQLIFKLLVAIFMVIFFFFLTVNELSATEPGSSAAVRVIAGAEVGCVAGLVVWKGYDGFKYLLGAGAGAWVGHTIISFFARHGFDLVTEKSGWAVLVLLNIPILLGMWFFGDATRARLLAIASSFYGGSMVSASLLFFGLALVESQADYIEKNFETRLSDTMVPWISFMLMLWNWQLPPAGFFSSVIPEGKDEPVAEQTDRVIGVVIWLFLWCLGYWFQSRRLATGAKKKTVAPDSTADDSSAAPSKPPGFLGKIYGRKDSASSDLRQPLAAK